MVFRYDITTLFADGYTADEVFFIFDEEVQIGKDLHVEKFHMENIGDNMFSYCTTKTATGKTLECLNEQDCGDLCPFAVVQSSLVAEGFFYVCHFHIMYGFSKQKNRLFSAKFPPFLETSYS